MSTPGIEELDVLHRHICQAIGDPKRIQILYVLHESPRHVTAIAEALNTPQPTVSRHLAYLKQRHMVTSEQDGIVKVYRLTDDRIIGVLDTMRQMLRDVLVRQTNVMAN